MHIEIPDKLELIKLPPAAEMTLFLIAEEMKNRRCMNRLEQAGFDTSTSASDLSVLILILVGFDKRPDALYEWYTEKLNNYCEHTDPYDFIACKQCAFDFYVELLGKDKRFKE